jgi:hypothetical protein
MSSVTVHIDVENDEKVQNNESYLISRTQIEKQIMPLIPSPYRLVNLTLHYLNKQIDVLLVLQNTTDNKTINVADLSKISESCRNIKYIGKVQTCLTEDKNVAT